MTASNAPVRNTPALWCLRCGTPYRDQHYPQGQTCRCIAAAAFGSSGSHHAAARIQQLYRPRP